MSLSYQGTLRRCACAAKVSSPYLRPSVAALSQRRTSRRWQTTDAASPSNPKIATIVDQISQLTLLETADLVSSLKVSPECFVLILSSQLIHFIVTPQHPRHANWRVL